MSFVIQRSELTDEQAKLIDTNLLITGTFNEYGPPKTIRVYDVEGSDVILPFAFYKKLGLSGFPNQKMKKVKTDIEFVGDLRPEQTSVIEEASGYLRENRSLLLNLPCNFGKTCLSIYIASQLRYHTLVVSANSVKLMNQWFERIGDFAPGSKVEKVTGKTKELDMSSQFHVCTATTVSKKGPEFFRDIGLLIVDEVHLIATSVFARGLQNIRPRFLIGMTATLDRTDGMDKVIFAHFGTERVKRDDERYFEVYRYSTGIKPEFTRNVMGRIDWGSVLHSQAMNETRNELIVEMIRYFPNITILILCKLVDHCRVLEAMLDAAGESVTSIYGSKKDYNPERRIIVGTYGKVSVGIDDQRIELVVLAGDRVDTRQSRGRARAMDSYPKVLDIVDNFPLLNRHFSERCKDYKAHNCKMYEFEDVFPEFKPPPGLMDWHTRKRRKSKVMDVVEEVPKRMTVSRTKTK